MEKKTMADYTCRQVIQAGSEMPLSVSGLCVSTGDKWPKQGFWGVGATSECQTEGGESSDLYLSDQRHMLEWMGPSGHLL